MNDLDQLYQQVILDHSKERHGEGALSAADAESHQVNPTCGDEVTLSVRIQDGKVQAVGWEGDGCSISQASISVMHDLVDGADLATVARLEREFDLNLISTAPNVVYRVVMEDGSEHVVTNPSDWPEGKTRHIFEPVVKTTVIAPSGA